MNELVDGRERGPAMSLAGTVATMFGPGLVAVAFGWWMLARRQNLLVDDAYISFRYAANLARGHGLVWNIGVPVEGYTCLLWVLLLSAIARLGVDLTLPAVLLTMFFGLGCLELMRRIARNTATTSHCVWDAVPGLMLASVPSFAHAMTSGMEETCFAFFVLLAIHLVILGRGRPALRAWAGAAFAAACLIRPEGPMVAGVALAVEASGLAGQRARVRDFVIPAACVALVVLLHTAVRLAYYGYPLPNTFYAKVIFGAVTLQRGAAHLSAFLIAGGWLVFLGYPRSARASALRPWLVHGYVVAIVYATYLFFVGGDHPHWFRFYIPLLPLPLLGVGLRLRDWAQHVPSRLRWAIPCCLAALVVSTGLPFSEACEPIVGRIDLATKKLMAEVDRFFDDVPKDSFVAVAAIGYVGYHHLDLHILDTWGLTDTHIAHMQVKPTVKFGHDKQDDSYVAASKPDYLYVFAPVPAPPLLGYDVCWPSENPPAAVYRRALPLAPSESGLGVPAQRKRRLEPPPACRPPNYAGLSSTPVTPSR